MIKGSLSLMLSQGQRPLPGVLYGDCLFSAVYGCRSVRRSFILCDLRRKREKAWLFDHAFLVLFLSL